MGNVKWLEGLREIAEDYDAFIFDLWGVVHNGSVAFPWSKECLVELKKLRKPVLFLSNSSRRCATNQAALERLGVSSDLYLDLITSGEVSWKILAGTCNVMSDVSAIREAKAVLTFGNDSDDAEYMKDLPYRVVDASEADLLLARGCFSLYGREVRSATLKDFDDELQVAAKRGVPMLVANPDVVRPDGNASPMPGRLAQRYRELGGPSAIFVGKPHPEVFQLARERLQEAGVASSARVCMVGDSVWHDVRGARAAGLDVLLLCSGVHSEALGIDQAPAPPRRPAKESLRGFLCALPMEEMPSYMSAALTWGTETQAEVVVCGLACMDIVQELEKFPEADDKVRALQTTWLGGGNAANTASALARLGRSTKLISKVGGDVLGTSILQGLSDEGVLTDLMKSEGQSAFSTVLVDADGTRTCVNSPASEMTGEEMREVLKTEAGAASTRHVRLIHLDGRHPQAALAFTDAVNSQESPAWISLDAERPREGLEPLLRRCDVLFCSARFPQAWTGKAGLPGALASLLTDTATKASMVVATRGERGSLLLVRKSFVKDPSELGTEELAAVGVPVVCCAGSFEDFYTLACDAWPVPTSFQGTINSTGAGDVFIAGFLDSLLNGKPLAFAMANGAYVATEKLQASGARLGRDFVTP